MKFIGGIVNSGYGRAGNMIEDIVLENGYENFEYIPYPGTVNLDVTFLGKEAQQKIIENLKTLPSIYDKKKNIYYIGEYQGETVYLINHKHKIELMAKEKLREKYILKNGDFILIQEKIQED